MTIIQNIKYPTISIKIIFQYYRISAARKYPNSAASTLLSIH